MAQRFAFGPFALDAARGVLLRDGAPIAVGQRALQVLLALLQARGDVVTKAALMQLAWPGLVVEESNLSVQIATLRKLLGPTPDGGDWIATVPRVGYRFGGALRDGDAPGATLARDPARPSIAVLRFANLSGDPGQEYFADGIAEDIIGALARFRWFTVVGRSASFAWQATAGGTNSAVHELGAYYLVDGSVRRAGQRLRISAELIDARHGSCLWYERYDVELDDMFAVQDRIALQIAGAIEPELLKSEGGLAATRPRGGSVTAWDLVAQGSWYFHQIGEPTHRRARELFREAIRIDPELMEARLWLARVTAGLLAFGWSDDALADGREGIAAGVEAVRLDEQSPYAHYALAIVGVFADSLDLALRAAEAAVELSPSFALGHLVFGMATLYSGGAEGSVARLERGLALNRHDPHNFIWCNTLALAYLFSERPADALRYAVASSKARPAWRPAAETAAASCAAAGDSAGARRWIEQASRLEPARGDALTPVWRRNPRCAERMQALLREAAGAVGGGAA